MKATIFAAGLFAATALAAPSPTRAKLQNDIRTLEVQIVNVLNDIVQQNKPALKKDYAIGTNEFAPLVSKLEGPQPCAPFTPGTPTTANDAVAFLQKSQLQLQQLSLDLMDPNKRAANSDFHTDVCQAYQYYAGVSKFANQ